MTTIKITDHDRGVDFQLDVVYSRVPAEPDYGLEFGFEIESIRCTEITTWCGKYGITGTPDDEIRTGAYCADKYAEEIAEEIRKVFLLQVSW